MALPTFFPTIEDTVDPTNSNLPIVKPASSNSGFGGTIFQHHLLADGAGGTVIASKHTGESNNKNYNTSSSIVAHMALVYNGHGGLVTPDYGQAVLNPNEPFNFAGIAISPTQFSPATWIEKFTLTSPSARLDTAMAFDIASNRSTLFGGTINVNGGQVLGDTWEWDGNQWLQKAPGTSPNARAGHAMTFDYYRNKVVLYGGQDANGSTFAETWEWNATTWTNRSAGNPGGLFNCALAFGLLQPGTGSQRYVTVLFGGQTVPTTLNGSLGAGAVSIAVASTTGFPSKGLLIIDNEQITYTGTSGGNTFTGCSRGANGTVATSHTDTTPVVAILNNTWEWNGSSWALKSTSHSPPARVYHSMAFDSVRNKVVIFGGSFGETIYADTWEYDGVDWQQVFVSINPSARSFASMVFNQLEKTMIMFGGFYKGAGLVLNDTWSYDGISWTQKNILGPAARAAHAMNYDSVQNKIVLFGGTDQTFNTLKGDTWQLNNPISPVLVQTSGDGYVYYDATGIFPIVTGNVNRTLGNFVIVTTTLKHSFNQIATTLSGSINDVVATIPVVSASNFPSSGIIFIESEQISYSGITPTSFTGCTRGYNGTAAVAHSNTTAVFIAHQFTITPLKSPDDTHFSSGTKTGFVLDGYNIAYFEAGANASSAKPLILKTLNARPVPSLGDFLGPSSSFGTVTSTVDGYSPIFGYAVDSPYIDPLTLNLYQTLVNQKTVGLIKMRMAPFFGFIPPVSSVITDFSPTSGIVGSTVIMNGAGFLGATSVTFDGYSSTPASYVAISNDQLSITVPAGAQTGTISVVTALGTTTSIQNYHVIPSITNVVAGSNAIGGSVTISGHTFIPVTTIDFNGTNQGTFTIVNDTSITTTIPGGATTGPLHVSSPDGIATFNNFSVVPPPTIDISGIAPTNGASGSLMSITGTGFFAPGAQMDGYGTVDFIPVSTTLNGSINNSVTTITVVATAGFPSTGIVFIESEQIFYTGTTPTTFTGCSRGYNGTSAASHTNGKTVITTPNGSMTNITRTVFSDSQIGATVPTPGGAQPSAAYFIKITTTGGSVTSTQSYSIVPKPTFLANNSFSPTSGAPGAVIDILGQYGFTGVSKVSFDGYQSPSVSFISDSHIKATVPIAPNVIAGVPISVVSTGGTRSTGDGSAAGGGPTSPQNFTILQQPSITSFTPASANTGTTIIVTGNNFLTADRVFFFSVANAQSTAGNVKRSATTIAAGSDGQTLPQATINVVTTAPAPAFPGSGTIFVVTDAGIQKVAYGGTAGGNSFTSCTGGTGTMHTGGAVYVVNVTTSSPHNFTDGDLVLVDTAGNAGTPTDANFPGAYVTITKTGASTFCYPQSGSSASSASTLSFADAQALGTGLSIINNQTINVVVPAAGTGIGTAGAGPITVSAGSTQPLSVHSGASFTYLPTPNISSLNVTSGGWGSGGGSATQVVINGTNLLNSNSTAPTVVFGGTNAVVLTSSSTQVVVNVPNGANNNITLTTDGGNATAVFTVVKPPVINNSTPTSNCAQNSNPIFINGNGFQQTGQIGNPKVFFYYQTFNSVTPTSISNTQINVNSSQLYGYFNSYSHGFNDVTFTIYVFVYYHGGAISDSSAYYAVTSPQTFTDLYCVA